MMEPDDPRVKKLQELAWGLQTVTNKPGGRLPDDFKRECYKLTSRAIALCSDVAYTEEEDFLERSKVFIEQLTAKKKKAGEVEEAEKAKLVGKCFRADTGGNYTVQKVADRAATVSGAAARDAEKSLISTAGGARALTASEVAARCAEDPGDLSLCALGLGDSDMEPICQGLKQAGAALTCLDLSHNLLADVGIQKLVSALASGTCPKLQELHVSHNSFGELGIQMLQGGLTKLRRGLVVHLNASDASDAATQPVARAPEADTRHAATPSAASSKRGPEEADTSAVARAQPDSAGEIGMELASSTKSESAPLDMHLAKAAGEADAACDESMKVEFARSKDSDELQVRVVLSLPDGVTTAAELDVDISDRRIIARTKSGMFVDSKLPCAVVADSAQAVFSRKRRTMTLTLQPVDPVAATEFL